MTGTDRPGRDPVRLHRAALEGFYWRLTDAASGRALVVFSALCRAPDGDWGFAGLAAHPGGFARWTVTRTAWGSADGRTLRFGDALSLDGPRLRVAVPGASLVATFEDVAAWPLRLGGLGVGHLVPGLAQYWHPSVLTARVRGAAEVDGRRIALDGAHAYAEKNWGSAFPERWWWGEAHDFPAAPGVVVAFAGGPLVGRLAASACVVRLPGGRVLRTWPPGQARTAPGRWELRARAGAHTVHVRARADPAAALALGVPVPTQRRARVASHQHLAGELHLRVRRGRRTVFAGTSALAGLESEAPTAPPRHP